jgi:hypothetical protein
VIFQTINAHLVRQGLLLREGTLIDARLRGAPSTKNRDRARDPDMYQAKKGKRWHFGMKAHIGVALHSGRVHTVVGTAAHVADVTQAHALLPGQETDVLGDAGYQGVAKRPQNQESPCVRACAAPCPMTTWAGCRTHRTGQGRPAGEGRAPVSRHQEPVQVPQDPLPGDWPRIRRSCYPYSAWPTGAGRLALADA